MVKGTKNKNFKILFIEDDPDQIMIYRNKFELEGFSFVSANNSQQAFEMIKKEKPDLVLLDLLLRNENGLDILAELKKKPGTRNITVIVFTNFDTPESREKALALGAVDYIVKAQVMPSEMIKKVKSCLEKKNV